MKNSFDVVIIGGGAAGLFLAARLEGVSVAIAESNSRVGKKLLATGNGKCNLTNDDCRADKYNDPRVGAFLARYGASDAKRDFAAMGLPVKSVEGRAYPYSECASSVLDVLRMRVRDKGVAVLTECTVTAAEGTENGFCLTTQKDGMAGAKLFARNVVLATGSDATFGRDSLSLYAQFGHRVRAFSPSLVPLLTDRESVKGLNGVRVKCAVTFAGRRETGEILFKDFGLSGIAAFDLSSQAARGRAHAGETIIIDFMPDFTTEQAETLFASSPAGNTEDVLRGVFHSKLCERIAARAGLAPSEAPDPHALALAAKNYRLLFKGTADKSYAQVMSGGLSLGEFDDDLQSVFRKGAFAVGEALDVDGQCGGYNLQWAWTSAAVVAAKLSETEL